MLVLSRRVNEKICIPELGITLEVVSVKGNSVRLGIDAPPEIRILRSEILDAHATWNDSEENNLQPTVKESRARYQCGNRNSDPTSVKGNIAV